MAWRPGLSVLATRSRTCCVRAIHGCGVVRMGWASRGRLVLCVRFGLTAYDHRRGRGSLKTALEGEAGAVRGLFVRTGRSSTPRHALSGMRPSCRGSEAPASPRTKGGLWPLVIVSDRLPGLVPVCRMGCDSVSANMNLTYIRSSCESLQTLNRKCTTSASCITYSLPSTRSRPASRIAFSDFSSIRSATE